MTGYTGGGHDTSVQGTEGGRIPWYWVLAGERILGYRILEGYRIPKYRGLAGDMIPGYRQVGNSLFGFSCKSLVF